jgi:hypothetical protein
MDSILSCKIDRIYRIIRIFLPGVFKVSSGNLEKILLILLILSKETFKLNLQIILTSVKKGYQCE